MGELSRAYVRMQGDPGRGCQKEISESTAAMSLRVRADERAQRKKWHATFVNVMVQVRPGIRDILRE